MTADLLDALGAAKEGSRDLDRHIWLGLGNRLDKIREYGKHEHERWVDKDGTRWAVATTDFSTSIDCALQLVPTEYEWLVRSELNGAFANVHGVYADMTMLIYPSGCIPPQAPENHGHFHATAATPALALCIAALRARAAHDTE